jgi:hypothetical protein
MTLPGFSAETSLYETRVNYRSTGASVQADGVMLQQLHGQLHGPPGICGPCVYDNQRGYCVRQCTVFGYRHTATCNCPTEGPTGDCPCEKFGGLCICPPPTAYP